MINIFPENFESLNILSEMLKVNVKCSERLTWGQTSETFVRMQKFMILDYLPCPCKIPIQNYFSDKIFIWQLIYKYFAAHFMTIAQENNLPFH